MDESVGEPAAADIGQLCRSFHWLLVGRIISARGGGCLPGAYRKHAPGEVYEYEDRVVLAAGTYWFLSRYTTLSNAQGEIEGVQIVSYDITARKQAQAELHRMRFAIDHHQAAIFIYGVDGRFNYVNDTACRSTSVIPMPNCSR